ncbi:MAG: hypothetical protein WBL27_00935 [Salinimicrobium sp.]
MEPLLKAFQKYFRFQLPQPLEQSGEIQQQDLRIRYVLTKEGSGKTGFDCLIFEKNGFPPVHKRIDDNGEIQELEKFEFSLMYETSEEKQEQETKMKRTNCEVANLMINKGLAERDEEWIQQYLLKT